MRQKKDISIGYIITLSNNKLIKNLNRSFTDNNLDITREQFVVLNALWRGCELNQQHLADKLQKDKYSITKLIDGLEKRGLVTRVEKEGDRRKKIIQLTKKSINLRQQIEEVVQETNLQILEGISDKDFATTVEVLQKIMKNIDNNEE